MASLGLTYLPPTWPTDGVFAITTPQASLEIAEELGYDIDSQLWTASSGGKEQDEFLDALPEAEKAAYEGALNGPAPWRTEADSLLVLPPDEAQGCDAQALRSVLADLPMTDPGIAEEITDAMREVDADARTSDALDEWVACMADHDIDAQSPAHLAESVLSSTTEEGGKAEGRRIATQDARCARDTTQRAQQELELEKVARIVELHPEHADIRDALFQDLP